MLSINSIKNINNIYFKQNKEQSGKTPQTNPQINELENTKPDFNVKTPMSYKKTGEIDLPYNTKAHCYQLSNGQKIVIIPNDGETVVKTYVNTGSMNETDNIRGISHFIEHNLFNGSKGIENGDFFKQVDKLGASTNASTGFAETNYYISSNLLNSEDLETKIKLHASMLESPLFAAEKLAKEKDIVNSEINMITSDPENIAVNKMLKNLYGINTNSTDMIGGTTDNINNLTREDVVNYYNNNYYPQNMVTVVTGEVEPDETIKLLSKYFTSTKQSQNRNLEKFNPVQKQIREDIISDKAQATTIAVGFNGPKSIDTKDRIYTEALTVLLAGYETSRLNNKLRELNSDIGATDEKISTNPLDGRAIMFIADSDEDNSEKTLNIIFNEINNIKSNPPTDKEINAVKNMMLKYFSKIFENSHGINNLIGTTMLENNSDYVKDFKNIVENMTSEDLVKMADKYLDVNKTSTVVIHPESGNKESIEKNYKNVSFTGSLNKEAINLSDVKEYSFNNNYRLITNNSKTDNCELLLEYKTDAEFKPEPAAAIILSELLNNGNKTKTKEELAQDLLQNGIENDFSASQKSITLRSNFNKENLDKAITSLKETLYNPRFNIDDFEKVKAKIKQTVLLDEKSAYDKLNSELYKGLPKGYSKSDILNSLERLTLDDVKLLYNDLLNHSRGVFVISAPFNDNKNLKNDVFKNISEFNAVKEFNNDYEPELYKPVTETKVLTDTDNKNQAEILMSYKFKVNKNLKDNISIRLLNTILGGNSSSRLFMDLRENEKLAYHVKSSYSGQDDIGNITLKINTTTDNKETGEKHFDNVEKSINGFKRHIEKIKSEKVTDEELNNAKLSLKNAILNNNHSDLGKSLSLLNSAFSPYGVEKTNMLLKEIDNITKDDIYNAANYIFSTKPTYSILATDDTLKANKDYLQSLTN